MVPNAAVDGIIYKMRELKLAENETKKRGSCLCGAVKYEVSGPLRDIIMCHCTQCQKTSGHHFAATAAMNEQLTITEDTGLSWYKSSDHAERGFCNKCGSSLFWRMPSTERTSILVGSFDDDVMLPVSDHLFVAERKHYYELELGIKQHPTYPKIM